MNKLTLKEWLLILGGLLLVLGVQLLPILLSSAEDEASQLTEQWREVGLSPSWESEQLDLGGNLLLDSFTCGELSAKRLTLTKEILLLREFFSTQDSLAQLAVLAESTTARGMSLDGVIALSYGLELAVELTGELTPAGLALRGDGFLRRGGAELPAQVSLVISPERVLVSLSSTESSLLAELHPRLEVISSTIQTEELAQLYPELPFKATGSVQLRGLPDDNRFTITAAELELRRRNAPESWLFEQLRFAVNGERWRLRTANLHAEGSGEAISNLRLDMKIDLGQLTGSLLPLGYQGAGELTVQLSLVNGEIQEFSLTGDSLSLSGEELSLNFSGELSYKDGKFNGGFEFDPGCGALRVSFSDGMAQITGDGLELTALNSSLATFINHADVGYLQSLLANQSETIILT
ncbi:hypothetical protein K8R78_00420, partial [bacterium]|nr:hypothetical protein [bacterium]